MTARYTHFSAAVSVGKCPRALTALRIRAFTLSIALVSGMRYVASRPAAEPTYGCGGRARGVRRNQLGQADQYLELRARVSTWPPLRLARLRCERESVSVASGRRFLDATSRGEAPVRSIGMDVHRSFAQLAVIEDGLCRDEGRIGVTPRTFFRPSCQTRPRRLIAWSFALIVRVLRSPCLGWWRAAVLLYEHGRGTGRRNRHGPTRSPVSCSRCGSLPEDSPIRSDCGLKSCDALRLSYSSTRSSAGSREYERVAWVSIDEQSHPRGGYRSLSCSSDQECVCSSV